MTANPDLQPLLDQIDRLDQETTPGPWEIVDEEYDDNTIAHVTRSAWLETVERIVHADDATPADREFIALARTALPNLAEAVREVKAIVELVREHYTDGHVADLIALTIADDIDHAIYDALGAYDAS